MLEHIECVFFKFLLFNGLQHAAEPLSTPQPPGNPLAFQRLSPPATRIFCLTICLIATILLTAGCTQNQINSLLENANPPEDAVETVEAPVTPPPKKASAPPATGPVSAIDVDPGSGREITMQAGYRMVPPSTFNVISEESGNDFRANYATYRWERLSGGAWYIVTFLSGLDYEGDRAPKIQDERVVAQRIRTAFARVDKKHQMRSNGSQNETLAGLKAVRTNVIGKIEGEDAVGHLYLVSDGKNFIEIVAVATESNRDVLPICRETAHTLSRGPAP